MKISLIVATYNRTEAIKYLLESLNYQTSRNFELIIVDQNKDDRIAKILYSFNNNFILKHFKLDEIGLSMARNYGLGKASYEIIGFPDDDCSYENDLIEKLLVIFTNNNDIDCVLAKNIIKSDKINIDYFIQRKEIENFSIKFCSNQIFLKRYIFSEIGFFDEKLGLSNWFGCGEETDILIKLIRKGKVAFYSNQIKVFHPTIIKKSRYIDIENIRSRSRGTGALWKKHNFKKIVIFRGLLSPVFKIILNFYSISKIRYFLNVMSGRIEGYRNWTYSN